MKDFFARVKLDERITFNISYLLIGLMMGCVAVSFIQFANRIFTSWSGEYVIIVVVVLSLMRIFSYERIQSLDQGQRLIYHAAEWVTIAVGLKLLLYALKGFDSLIQDLLTWQTNFISFFSGEYIPILVLLGLTWLLSGQFANDMEELRVDKLDLNWEVGILENRRQDARTAIINRILWLGAIMIFAAILTRVDIAALFGPYFAVQVPVINVLLYFLAALLLFSQTHYSLLRGRWMWHKTEIPTTLGVSWFKYGLGFLLLITIIAFLLPTHYSFGFLELLRFIIALIIQIVLLVFAVLSLPFGWLLSLLSGSKSIDEPLPTPELANILPQNTAPAANPTLELIQTIIFWGFLVGLVSFSIIFYFRQNSINFKRFPLFPHKNWLTDFISLLWSWLHGSANGLREVVAAAQKRLIKSSRGTLQRMAQRLPNFRLLSPRQRIIFFYTHLLELARENGIPRHNSQTPAQYSSILKSELPENSPAIEGITRAFEEARFSQHQIPPESSHHVQTFWNQLAKSIKFHRKPG